MVYHFGFVLYEQGGVYFILSVSKGRLKLYYFRDEESSLVNYNGIDKKFPLQDFCWDEFENSGYSKNKKYPQMSFVFFGVNSIKRKECPIIESQVKECDEDTEVAFLVDNMKIYKVSEHISDERICGFDYKEICFNYSRTGNRCGIFFNDKWQNHLFSDVECSWCKIYCINKEETDLYQEIHDLFQAILKSPKIVDNTDIEEIISHLYVEYENGYFSRPGKDDIEYSNKITKLETNADSWLIDFLEVGRVKTDYSKWKSIADYRSWHNELKGQELSDYRSEVVSSYSKEKHLNGLLCYQTGAISKCISSLKLLHESQTNELLKYGDIKKFKFWGHQDVINTYASHKNEYISLIESTLSKINKNAPHFGW